MNKVFFIVTSIVVGFLTTACNNSNSVNETKETSKTEVVSHYVNGSPQIERDFKIVDGVKTATYEREYYEDGNLLKEGPLNKDEKRDGLWKSYYRDGVLWSEGGFVNGIREGKTVTYFSNGKKYYDGKFVNAKKSGVWKFYDEQGEFVNETYYDHEKNTAITVDE